VLRILFMSNNPIFWFRQLRGMLKRH